MRIKKMISLTAVLLTVIAGDSLAQKIFYVTPKVGLNQAFFDDLSRVGYDIGCATEWAFTPRFTFESGLLFTIRNRYIFHSQSPFIYSEDYIYVPILAKIFVHRGFNVFSGLQFGVKVNDNNNEYYSSTYTGEFSSLYCLGFGYLFNMGLSLSTYYNINLYTFRNFVHPPQYHRTFQFNVGWSF